MAITFALTMLLVQILALQPVPPAVSCVAKCAACVVKGSFARPAPVLPILLAPVLVLPANVILQTAVAMLVPVVSVKAAIPKIFVSTTVHARIRVLPRELCVAKCAVKRAVSARPTKAVSWDNANVYLLVLLTTAVAWITVVVGLVVAERVCFVLWKEFATIPPLVLIRVKAKGKNVAQCAALIAASVARVKPVLLVPVSRSPRT